MRPALALALLGWLTSASFAQARDLEQAFEQKLAKEFVKNASWVMDYDAALKQAKESNRLIFAYFTRSYAP